MHRLLICRQLLLLSLIGLLQGIGMLSDVKNSVQKMKPFAKADAFAITLEKKGGSPSPTMEAMYVMGKV